jgi:SAM-dependent methyltransferase
VRDPTDRPVVVERYLDLMGRSHAKQRLRAVARDGVNSVLHAVGFELTRRNSGPRPFSEYLDFDETLSGAERAGCSVGDFIDATYNQPGMTQRTIDELAALGVFSEPIERVCEIGAGSGRYVEKTLARCQPSFYEVYETSRDWREWLASQYRVVVQPADGARLSHTSDQSIDLVQAHKVFSGIAAMKTIRYLVEMTRVIRGGGQAVFDVVTEDCLDDETLNRWLTSRADYDTYPAVMPKTFVINFFTRRGFSLSGSFLFPMPPGKTEYMAFRREQ